MDQAWGKKSKDNYPERDYKITTCGSPTFSISNKIPAGETRFKNIGDPIAYFDRGAEVIGWDIHPFKANSFENSKYTSGDTGGWLFGDTSKGNSQSHPDTSQYTTLPIEQSNLDNEQ